MIILNTAYHLAWQNMESANNTTLMSLKYLREAGPTAENYSPTDEYYLKYSANVPIVKGQVLYVT